MGAMTDAIQASEIVITVDGQRLTGPVADAAIEFIRNADMCPACMGTRTLMNKPSVKGGVDGSGLVPVPTVDPADYTAIETDSVWVFNPGDVGPCPRCMPEDRMRAPALEAAPAV
jgi:hypothetical protein